VGSRIHKENRVIVRMRDSKPGEIGVSLWQEEKGRGKNGISHLFIRVGSTRAKPKWPIFVFCQVPLIWQPSGEKTEP
jgi:hypothetical protein